jgi:hypothetical protein
MLGVELTQYRLKKTGVMSVKNPVETAFQEGRFLELDDDAESE